MTKKDAFIPDSIQFYKSVVSVYCPILKDTIFFTSNGLNHLFYKPNRKPRIYSETYLKLVYVRYAPEAIGKCIKIREMRCVGGTDKKVFQYELYYERDSKIKLGILVQRIGMGKYTFLSVKPYRRKKRNNKKAP